MWRKQALCKKLGPGIWYSHAQTKQGKYAISVCNKCPVKKECLLEVTELEKGLKRRVGIWGGLGPYERAKK